jgi:acetyl-CoA synthetase
MRRILRKIAEDDLANLGDTSTLAEPAVVDDLVKNRAGRGDDEAHIDGKIVSCAQLEARLADHSAVSEVAVVAVDAGRGEALWAFVTPDPEIMASDVLAADIKGYVRREVGPHAVPVAVIFGPLPKTPAGEVLRPVLRRIAETGDAGDTSGLDDPAVATALVKLRAVALA